MLTQPKRRVGVTHTWDSQAKQYARPDIIWTLGINHWTVPKDEAPVPIECLLYFNPEGRLLGILNYYPEGSPFGEVPHDLLVLVDPAVRRCGIGTWLLTAAMERWPAIDLTKQAYTDQGWALATSVLATMEDA